MNDRETIAAMARAIAANAEIIARHPDDWASTLQARANMIRADLMRLDDAIRDRFPGDR
jgi:hypothetical protein